MSEVITSKQARQPQGGSPPLGVPQGKPMLAQEQQVETPLDAFNRLMQENGLAWAIAAVSPSGVRMPVGDFLPERFRVLLLVDKAK